MRVYLKNQRGDWEILGHTSTSLRVLLLHHLPRYGRLADALLKSAAHASEVETVYRFGMVDILREVYDKAILVMEGIAETTQEHIWPGGREVLINTFARPSGGRKLAFLSEAARVGLFYLSKYSGDLAVSAQDFSDSEILGDSQRALAVVDAFSKDMQKLLDFLDCFFPAGQKQDGE